MKFTTAVAKMEKQGFQVHFPHSGRACGKKGYAILDVYRNGTDDKVATIVGLNSNQLSSGPHDDYNWGASFKTMAQALRWANGFRG